MITVIIFFAIVGLAILGFVLASKRGAEGVCGLMVGVLALMTVLGVVGCIELGEEYIGINGRIANYQQHYNSLMYQLTNKVYNEDITTNSYYQLIEEVTHWNCDLAKRQALQNDLFLGIFYADIYDQFEFIPLELIGGESVGTE